MVKEEQIAVIVFFAWVDSEPKEYDTDMNVKVLWLWAVLKNAIQFNMQWHY